MDEFSTDNGASIEDTIGASIENREEASVERPHKSSVESHSHEMSNLGGAFQNVNLNSNSEATS